MDEPMQTEDGPLMVALGTAFTVTVLVAAAVQPLAFVPVTVYDVVVLGETMMLGPTRLVLHT
jgi:hypothetical protein